jgi:hypothetical protein
MGSFNSKPCCLEIKSFLMPLSPTSYLPPQVLYCFYLPDPVPELGCFSPLPAQPFCTSSCWKACLCVSLSSFSKLQCKCQPYQNSAVWVLLWAPAPHLCRVLEFPMLMLKETEFIRTTVILELEIEHQRGEATRWKSYKNQSTDWNKLRAPDLQDHILPSTSFCCRDVGVSLFPPQGWDFLEGKD